MQVIHESKACRKSKIFFLLFLENNEKRGSIDIKNQQKNDKNSLFRSNGHDLLKLCSVE